MFWNIKGINLKGINIKGRGQNELCTNYEYIGSLSTHYVHAAVNVCGFAEAPSIGGGLAGIKIIIVIKTHFNQL